MFDAEALVKQLVDQRRIGAAAEPADGGTDSGQQLELAVDDVDVASESASSVLGGGVSTML